MARRVTVKDGMAFHGSANIRNNSALPSGRWHARFRDRDGQQKSAPQTFTTKADAGRWLSRTQADIERGEFVDPMLGK